MCIGMLTSKRMILKKFPFWELNPRCFGESKECGKPNKKISRVSGTYM